MSETPMPNPELEPKWQAEIYSFGNADFPTKVIYRTCGERTQRQDVESFSLTATSEDKQAMVDARHATELLISHEDCTFAVAEGHAAEDGTVVEPSFLVAGWHELTTNEEKEVYEQDRYIGFLS